MYTFECDICSYSYYTKVQKERKNLYIIYCFLIRNSIFKRYYAGTFDISSDMFSNVISLVLRDSDKDSEKRQFDTAFCIRWPGSIIDRYIIKVLMLSVLI